MVQERPEAGELREQHHIHPRIVVHGDLNARLHGIEVAGILEIHLNAGDGVWHHVVLAFNVLRAPRSNSWAAGSPCYRAMITGPGHEGTPSITKSLHQSRHCHARSAVPMMKQANA